MIGSLGLPELLIVLAIVVLLFGVGKLPKLGRGLGEGCRQFRESLRCGQSDEGDACHEECCCADHGILPG